MAKPLFRIEQLISALLKGSPDDPVYLKVGPTTYGIKSITDGSIRVTTGNQTQDAAQVVKTLRRYATGTPKGEDTGIAWRIVGVGGGTAIKSVSHDGSRIVVTTLANEGKAAEESGGCHHCGKKGHDSQGLCVSCNKPWFGPRTKDMGLVSFEAPRKGPKPKDGRPGRKVATPSKRAHNSAVSSKISQIMRDYDKTGKIGSSKPKNRAAAIKQAVAVAYSMVNKDYSKSGKRLPTGVRRAENQDMMCCGDQMEFHEDYFYCPVCETSIETDEFKAFGAPMGYAPDGPRPFYGNPRKLVRDRWGNLRFIRRRKDGTYMDNVDFGRSIRADLQRQAKTWAPGGFRDQGDGSLDLLTSLMGAENDDLFRDTGYYEFVVDLYDNEGNECQDPRRYLTGKGSTIQQAVDHVRKDIIEEMEREQRRITKAQSRNTAPRATARRSVAGARFVEVSQFDPDEWRYVEIGADLPADIKFNTAMAAESNDTVWLVESWMDGVSDGARLFSKESDARAVFEEYIRNLRGDPADAPDGDWVADQGFQRVMMYQVTIE